MKLLTIVFEFFYTWIKGIVFFFYTEKFVFVIFFRNFEWMNEKCLFFFPGLFFRPKIWMNEWLVNFSRKKKNTKKHNKIPEKKKHNQLLLKKIGIRQKSEWMTDELFLGKKKTSLCFFSPVFSAKKHRFWIWMNEWPTSMPEEKKIRYLFSTDENNVIGNQS